MCAASPKRNKVDSAHTSPRKDYMVCKSPAAGDVIWTREALPYRSVAEIRSKPFVFQHIEVVESQIKTHGPQNLIVTTPVIRMYGSNQNGNSVVVTIHNFKPYFYAEVPAGDHQQHLTQHDLAALQRRLNRLYNDEMGARNEHPDPVLKIEFVQKKTLFHFKGYNTKTFLKITIAAHKAINKLRDCIAKKTHCLDTKKTIDPMECYEYNIEYKLRFMVDKDITGCNWIELPAGKFIVTACPTLKPPHQSTPRDDPSYEDVQHLLEAIPSSTKPETHCQLEIHVDEKDLVSHKPTGQWMGIAPFRVLSFDIECKGRELLFPDPLIDPVIQIAAVVQLQDANEPLFKSVFTLGTCASIVGAEVFSFQDERDLLSKFAEYIVAVDPDIITGYNVLNFDFNYLIKRAEALKLEMWPKFTRCRMDACKIRQNNFGKRASSSRESLDISIQGRIIFDVMQFIMREKNLRSYSLNSVSAEFLGEQKEDVHFSIISQLQDGDEQTRKRLAVYCLKDALLPLRLLFKLLGIVNFVEMSRVTGVPITYLLTRGQQIKIISQLLRKTKSTDYVIPVIPTAPNAGEDGAAFEGATVIDPIKGYYSTPIATLDFASLYPSIMIAHNLCYTTFVAKTDFKSLSLDPSEYITTPSGDRFLKPERVQGLLPEILQDLLAARKEAKMEMAKETNAFRKSVLDGRQLALKISANSVYGFTGALVGRLPCIEISQSVTSFGREMILKVKTMIEVDTFHPEYHCRVIYGDTDSVMVQMWKRAENLLLQQQQQQTISQISSEIESPLKEVNRHLKGPPQDPKGAAAWNVNLEEAMMFGADTSKRITSTFKQPIKLEFEKIYYPYLLISKKRYAGLFWTNPNKYDKMDCKGLEAVRRDNCPLTKNLVTLSLQNLLIHKDKELAERNVRKVIADLLQNKVDISELVITKALSKQGEDYHGKQAHVELATRMKKRDPQSAPKIGDRIPFVIIKAHKGAAAYEKAEDPIYVLENGIPIDTNYYLTNQLSKPLLRIFEPVLGQARANSLLHGDHTRNITKELPATTSGIMAFAKKMDTCMGCKTVLQSSRKSAGHFCDGCADLKSELYQREIHRLNQVETKFNRLWVQCQRCQGSLHQEVLCTSRDCPIFYMRKKIQLDLKKQTDIVSKFEI